MRRADWVSRLFAVFKQYQNAEFSFGKHDCAMLSARCIDAMTGSDWSESLTYGDRRGAVRFLRAEGGLEAAVTKRLGEPVNGYNARRGDICLIDKTTLGVCIGSVIAVCSDNSIEHYPLNSALKHWRVE